MLEYIYQVEVSWNVHKKHDRTRPVSEMLMFRSAARERMKKSITRARDRSRTGLGYGKPSVVQVFVDLSGRRPQGLID